MDAAPFFSFPDEPAPAARAFWLQAEDGIRLRAAHWPAAAAAGTVLLFNGRAEYLEKYAETAHDLNCAGFDVISLDWRGQGLSDRLLPDPRPGQIRDFADYQRDVVELLVAAQDLALPRPWHLLAHSMGGAIGLAALATGLPVQSAVFSAPMWGINLGRVPEPLALGLARLASRLGHGGRPAPASGGLHSFVLKDGFLDNPLTSDGRRWGRLVSEIACWPEIALAGASYDWLGAALRECRRLEGLPAPALPVLIAVGPQDGVVSAAAVRRRAAAWPGAELLELPGCRHEALIEREALRETFLAAAIAHFRAAG